MSTIDIQAKPIALRGRSLMEFSQSEVDHSQTLLGDRYLCRGGSMFIVAPSGQGKSTLAVQLAAEWAIGADCVGIRPNGKLRTLIIQAEDDDGDITEMSRWILDAGYTPEHLKAIANNVWIEPCKDKVGDSFIAWLDGVLAYIKPDIVIINPYTSYIGDDAKDERAANHFLREGLSPLLEKHRCGCILMHHTPKTQYSPSADFTTADFMYRGAGCATMTNWARAYLVFEPVNDDGLFRFVAAKRGKRIGWDGHVVRFYRHSRTPGVLKWEQASSDEIEAAKAKKANPSAKVIVPDEKLLSVFSPLEPIGQPQAVHAMQGLGASRDAAKNAFARFRDSGSIVEAESVIETGCVPSELAKKPGVKAHKYLLANGLRNGAINTDGLKVAFRPN